MIRPPTQKRISVVFTGGVGSDLAVPVIRHLRFRGIDVFATPSKKYPERNADLSQMGVELVKSVKDLEELHQGLVTRQCSVRCLDFSSTVDLSKLAHFSSLSPTLHISTALIAKAWLEEQKLGSNIVLSVPYLQDKLAATRIKNPNLCHVLIGFVITTGTSANTCMSSDTLAKLADPERTGASKHPEKWWDDAKACTSQERLTEAVLNWIDKPCAGGVYRLTSPLEYSRRAISMVMTNKDPKQLFGTSNYRTLSYASVPQFPVIDPDSTGSIEQAFRTYARNASSLRPV